MGTDGVNSIISLKEYILFIEKMGSNLIHRKI